MSKHEQLFGSCSLHGKQTLLPQHTVEKQLLHPRRTKKNKVREIKNDNKTMCCKAGRKEGGRVTCTVWLKSRGTLHKLYD